jgi:hypothetical protein
MATPIARIETEIVRRHHQFLTNVPSYLLRLARADAGGSIHPAPGRSHGRSRVVGSVISWAPVLSVEARLLVGVPKGCRRRLAIQSSVCHGEASELTETIIVGDLSH